MNSRVQRALTVLGIVAVTGFASFWAWPRPALDLRVELGGRGVIVDRWGRTTPLPETVFVSATGRNTKVRLDNRDTTYQTLGIFGAAARSERSFSVPLPGAYGGYCSAHTASNTITYVVQ